MPPTPAPEAGEITTLGGRDVHLVDSPGSSPVVVFLGGCGVPSYHWDDVVAGLSPEHTVRVDRPGLLGTRWPGTLPTLADEVETLSDLAARLGEAMVLVGHSMAGPHIEAFTRLHPEHVAGVVQVDASVEWRVRPQRSGAPWLAASRFVYGVTAHRPFRALGSALDRVGVAAMSHRRITDPVRPVARATYRNRDVMASVVAEQAAYSQQMYDLAQVREHHPWPGTPAIVLAATAQAGRSARRRQRWLADQLGAAYWELTQSRHLVMIDDPRAIVAAVKAVLRTAEAAR